VTKNRKLLIVVVALVAVLGAYWMLVLSPKRAEIAALDSKLAKAQAGLSEDQASLASYKKARSSYKANYATVVRLGKAVPKDDDVRSLVVQLSAAAERSGVDFGRIQVGGTGSATGPTVEDEDAAAGPPGSVSVGGGGFSAMPFTLAFDGRFKNMGRFLARLEHFVTVTNDEIAVTGRLLRLESISLKPGIEGFPQIRAEIGASSYLLPGSADASGETAADGTSTAEATPSSGTTKPPTTAATSTGAIR
jgi:Tfp pilus assembly protein PilO